MGLEVPPEPGDPWKMHRMRTFKGLTTDASVLIKKTRSVSSSARLGKTTGMFCYMIL